MQTAGLKVGEGSVTLVEINSINAQVWCEQYFLVGVASVFKLLLLTSALPRTQQAWPMDDLLPGPRGLPAVTPACLYSQSTVKGLRVQMRAKVGGAARECVHVYMSNAKLG